MRRLEIPEDMQKKYGFPALGGANSATKQLIFGANAARLYRINLKATDNTRMPAYSEDRLASLKNEYGACRKGPVEPALRLRPPRVIDPDPATRRRLRVAVVGVAKLSWQFPCQLVGMARGSCGCDGCHRFHQTAKTRIWRVAVRLFCWALSLA